MSVSDEGQTAISELNGKNLKGNAIKVEEGRRKISHSSDRDRQDGFGSDRGGRDRRDGFDRGGRGGPPRPRRSGPRWDQPSVM